MKRKVLAGILLSSLLTLVACDTKNIEESSANDVSQSQSIAETVNSQIDEEIVGQTISEHFTKELSDEVWLEILADEDGAFHENPE
ncbi:hypothetical protein I6N95_25730 [Vagococcus sp. BWB3-3]|uniref:Uncharacterized protein n=1 Tax=Vagococcus allomyrinae TaxID=2794353 RepID=A0A940SZG8_9ENTE|nr:hypothetical protein [Vagococcus allomyrinae]MBP1044413.1 hypothetical protein [Vagococcus allomyrinae]